MHPWNREFLERLDNVDRLKQARLKRESIYAHNPPRLPLFGQSEESRLGSGPGMPHVYARAPTLSEIQDLRQRLHAAENIALQREESCRICFVPFRGEGAEVQAHYQMHRDSTSPLCPFCGEDWGKWSYMVSRDRRHQLRLHS